MIKIEKNYQRRKERLKGYARRVTAVLLTLVMAMSMFLVQVGAVAWDSNAGANSNFSRLRFWEDEAPGIRFYMNAAARYTLETVPEPKLGSTRGEWMVMDLLRGMYMGLDYVNYIPENFFSGYTQRLEDEVRALDGRLDRNKITEWCRVMLPLSAMGYDLQDVAGYDFLDKMSQSYAFSYRQGLNGPIWQLIAMDTGSYEFYAEPSQYEPGDINTRGKLIDHIINAEIKDSPNNTIGGWSLNDEYAKESGADADITGMALQALAPYYLDANKYQASGATIPRVEFMKAVERGIYSLNQLQTRSGGFGGWGSANINAESTVQVIVALTALGIDPKAESVPLENIGRTARFRTPGGLADNVRTNNMIDALLTFWAKNSGSSEAVGGFKHVTTGHDGGGGAGHVVNTMATEQSLYALIAYDRFLNGENSLYDMTDMTDGSYTQLQPSMYEITYMNGDGTTEKASFSPYAEVSLPVGKNKNTTDQFFVNWNTKPDGTGVTYRPNEVLSMPEQSITLYAQYGLTDFSLSLEPNGGILADGVAIPSAYTPFDEDILLPTAEQISKDGYIFKGWYTDSDYTGSPVTAVTKGSYGDKVFYARWDTYYANIMQFSAYVVKLKPGSIKVSDGMTIKRAQELYDSMSAAEKDNKDCKFYYNILVQAKAELDSLLEKMEAADIVIDLIGALTELTLDKQDAVTDARSAYEALSDDEKELVTNYEDLIAAEEQMEILKADKAASDEVTALIKAIGEVSLDSEQAITESREAYNALTAEQQALMDPYYVQLLETAERTLSDLKEREARIQNVKDLASLIPEDLSLEDDSLQLAADAKAAYIALSDDERSELPSEIIDGIEAALDALMRMATEAESDGDYDAAYAVELVIAWYGGIVDLEWEEAIQEIRASYDALTNVQKALVTNYFSLVQMELSLQKIHADVAAAAGVDDLISQIGEVTLERADFIAQVRTAYLRLTNVQKQRVQYLSVLIAAEQVVSGLKYDYTRAQDVIAKINAIGEVTLDSKERLLKAESAYEALTDAQKQHLTAEQVKILTDARAAYDELYKMVLKEITLSQSDVTLQPAETLTLSVTYNPEDTTSDKTVVWQSSDEEVATVKDGVITAVGNGEAAIIARAGKVTAICAVHVKTPLSGITLNKTELKFVKGDFEYLMVGYLPADTTDDRTVAWSSSNPKAVTVNADGRVTAVGSGSAVITAKVGAFTQSCKITAYPYKITYRLDGGTNSSDNTPGYTGPWNVALKNPTKEGYTFGGWYTDQSFKNKITMIKKGSNKNYVLYAKWVKVTAPGKPVISSLTHPAANSMKIVLKGKVTGAVGYQVLYADNSAMKDAKIIYTTAYKGRTITSLVTGRTYYVKVRAYKKDSTGQNIYGSYSTTQKVTLTKPATPWIRDLTNSASKTMTVGLSRNIYGAYGYQIVYATNSAFTAGKKTANTTAITKKISGLQKGKTYYVKVRAMTKINGKNTFGAYSTVKKVKITK